MADHAPLVWDQIGEHWYENGVDKTVLYKFNKTSKTYGAGVAWNGVTSIEESPSGAESNKFYADNIEYLNLTSAEEYGATLNAYDYPDEFESCNGGAEVAPGVHIGQQPRDTFALAYRTLKGNDADENAGYVIHLVYGCKAAPSSKSHSTKNDSPEPVEMSWELSTTQVPVTGHKPTATIDIDSTKTDSTKLTAFEKILYGSTEADARIPLPDEVARLLGTAAAAAGGGNANGNGNNLG